MELSVAFPDMQLPHVFIAFFMRDQAFPHVFITFLAPPSFLLGARWALLGGMLVELWSFLGILWVQNGARNIKMRVIKAILAQVERARGSQRPSMDRLLGRCSSLVLCYLVFWYVCFVRDNLEEGSPSRIHETQYQLFQNDRPT